MTETRPLADVIREPLTDEAKVLIEQETITRMGYLSSEEYEAAITLAAGLVVAEAIARVALEHAEECKDKSMFMSGAFYGVASEIYGAIAQAKEG